MILNSPTISGSLTVTGNIIASGSITLSGSVASASYAATASFVALAQSASNAVSAETASFANAFTVASTLTAQTLVVQTITSSVDFVTGSTRFGSILGNTHVFSGSVTMNPGGLFVSSSGNVGIGITNPDRLLQISNTSGQAVFSIIGATNDSTDIFFGDTDNKAEAVIRFINGTNTFNILQGGSTRMTINASGSVGIGTSSPTSYFYSGNGLAIYNATQNTLSIATDATGASSLFFSNGTSGGSRYNGFIEYYHSSNAMAFGTNGGGERMRINSSGNVGIGTSSPSNILELGGATNKDMALVSTSQTSYVSVYDQGMWLACNRKTSNGVFSNASLSSAAIYLNGANGGSSIEFRTIAANNTAPSTRMTIDSSGNVLLNNVAAQFQWEGGNYWTWRTVTSGTEFWLYRGDTGASPLIMTTGNVLRLSSLAGVSSRTVTADASGNLSASSDSSLKQEDTTHTIEGLAEILQLKPRAYKWLSDIEIRGEEATTEIGFFANEVNSIIPSAAPKGNDNLYGFYDRAVIAALTKAIQELKTQNDALQSRIETLESK